MGNLETYYQLQKNSIFTAQSREKIELMFGFLRNLFGKSKEEKALLQSQVNEVLVELEKVSQKEVIYIKTTINNDMDLLQSKIGGLPYVPLNSAILEEAQQNNLYLLAQINLNELPQNGIIKKKSGILQFWIDRDCYGMDKSKVIFYEEIGEYLSKEEVLKNYTPKIDGIKNDLALSFERGYEMINATNNRFDTWFSEIWREKFGENYHKKDWHYILDCQDFFQKLRDKEEYFNTHKIGGYPYYVRDVAPSDKDVVLLQVRAEMKDKEWCICFMDCGVANFHISKEELEKSDFSQVFYNIDCY